MKAWIAALLLWTLTGPCLAGEKHPEDHEFSEPIGGRGFLHRIIHNRLEWPELYLVCIHGVNVQPHGIKGLAAQGWEELVLDCTVVDRFRGKKQVGERIQYRRYLDGKAVEPEKRIGELRYVAFLEERPGLSFVDPQDPTCHIPYSAELASLVDEHRAMAKKEQAADDQLAKKAPSILAAATRFSIGPVGEAGEPSQAELALRVLARRPDAVAECRKLIEKSTPAGQLNGLYGLRWLDEAAFKQEIARIKESTLVVMRLQACIVSPTTVGELAEKIEIDSLE